MLAGKVNSNFNQYLYGASLCALKKKDGGIRPIAVGSIFRRLVSKLACSFVSNEVADYFKPQQLGFGIKGGCEAAVHSVRSFILQDSSAEVLVKLDVKNAFNSVERDTLCHMIKEKIPKLYSYLWQCYSEPSKLFYNGQTIESCVGCQQGDPLGPAIFSLAIQPVLENLKSNLNIWFQAIGLLLNFSKCELFFCPSFPSKSQAQAITEFSILAPNIRIISRDNLSILGSPLLETGVPSLFKKLLEKFNILASNITHINPHMALYILRHCFWIPKLNYYMRCCPFWKFFSFCESFDSSIRSVLENMINIKFTTSSWKQASLPIIFGGLGIRAVSDIALPAFLSSIHACSSLIDSILSFSSVEFRLEFLNEAENLWLSKSQNSRLPSLPYLQKSWDTPLIQIKYDSIFTNVSLREKAILLSLSNKESGAWLEALPSPQLGTLLDKVSLQIAVSLRLRTPFCHPHLCVCGSEVDSFGLHGLSCTKSAGRISRHACINDILKRAFNSAEIPCILEPSGLFRDDGKRPDGVTLIPWKGGRCFVWDVTCADTVAPSHLVGSSKHAGFAASAAEQLKHSKYKGILDTHLFCAFAVETLGPWSEDAKCLLTELGTLLKRSTGIPMAKAFKQSIAIQRGNAASVLGTIPLSAGLEEVFLLF